MITLDARLVQGRKALAAVVILAALGCDGPPPSAPAPNAAAPIFAAIPAGGPHVEVPIWDQVVDLNPCTGEVVTTTFAGTAQLQQVGDKAVYQIRGTATTSDGYVGTFNWTWVLIGDRVAHFRLFDTEISNDTGQRITFAAAVNHMTSVAGQPVVQFLHLADLRCVGPRSP